MTLEDALSGAQLLDSPHVDLGPSLGLIGSLKVGLTDLHDAAFAIASQHQLEPPQVTVEYENAKLALKRSNGETMLTLSVSF